MIAGLVVLALIIYGIVSLIMIRSNTAAALEEKNSLEAQVEEITQDNAKLEYQIEHADDDDTIKDIAREKLGLVMPGEIIFYDESN